MTKLYPNGGTKPKEGVDKSSESDIIDIDSENAGNEFKKAIEDGKLSTKLNKKAQMSTISVLQTVNCRVTQK